MHRSDTRFLGTIETAMRFPRLLIATICAVALLCVPAGADAAPAKSSKQSKMTQCKWAAKKKPTAKQRRAATRRCSQRWARRTVKRSVKRQATTTQAAARPQASTPTAEAQPAAVAAPVVTTPMQDELVACTNRERVAAGLSPVSIDPALIRAAQGHAEDMNARNYFDHVTPEGRTPWDRIRAQLNGADPFGTMGENIAKGFSQAQATCDAWMASPAHRENIMNADFELIGTGYVAGYAVQNFGAR